MYTAAFVSAFTGGCKSFPHLPSASRDVSLRDKSARRPLVSMARQSKEKGFFGKLKESILRPIVSVPGSKPNAKIYECVFCKGSGVCNCDACKGSGKDTLGTCLMCGGKTSLTCTVCLGVGMVDIIRRGGTDDSNTFIKKKQI